MTDTPRQTRRSGRASRRVRSQKGKHLSIMLTNIRGLLKSNPLAIPNIDELRHRALREMPTYIIATETHIDDTTPDSEISIPGYQLPIRCDRNRYGGGIAVWAKTGADTIRLEDAEPSDLEVIWLSVKVCKGRMLMGAVYRPGSLPGSDVKMIRHLEDQTSVLQQRIDARRTVILGDFNVHHTEWLSCTSPTDTAGKAAKSFALTHGLVQIVKEATRGNNCLDLILTDAPLDLCTATVTAPIGSTDHYTVTALIPDTVWLDKPTKRTLWHYSKADWGRLKKQLKDTDWDSILKEDPENACTEITNAILSAAEKHIPSSTVTHRPKDQPWFNAACSRAILLKATAFRAWRDNPIDVAKHRDFLSARRETLKTIRRAKAAYRVKLRERLISRGRDRDWWWTVKSLTGQGGSQSIPTLVKDGTTYTTARDKSEALSETFAEKCRLDISTPVPEFDSRTDRVLTKVMFRPRDVRRYLKKLDTSKAVGPDKISPRVLREAADELALPLTKLFRYCFAKGHFPSQWKNATVVPVHKKKSRSDTNNYRPISLLSAISKVMEAMINKTLMSYLLKNKLVSALQFGFRPNHSAPDVLQILSHQISSTLTQRQETRVVALDIKGAFDRVWHEGLMRKLTAYGITGQLHAWLQCYLSGRSIEVVVEGQRSAKKTINAGVPQGSILGPTLFLLYINDLPDCIKNSKCLLYADDSTLFNSTSQQVSRLELAMNMNTDLEGIASWGRLWNVMFEPSKCNTLLSSNKRETSSHPSLIFDGIPVSTVDDLNLLGVVFSKNNSWQTHIHNIGKAAGQRTSILNRLASVLDSHGMATVYRTFIRSKMEYAALAWMNASATHLRVLDRVQQRALVHMNCYHSNAPHLGVLGLQHRRDITSLSCVYRMQSENCPSLLRELLPARLTRRTCTRQSTRAPDHALDPPLPPGVSAQHTLGDFDRSFLTRGIQLWNLLPSTIVGTINIKNRSKFKHRASAYIRLVHGL